MAGKPLVIEATVLYDGKTKRSDTEIIVEGENILEVTTKKYAPRFRGVVTPAFIDAHSHIGMERQGEPSQESEVNDEIDQFTPLHNPLDSIYFDDRAFAEAVDFGVLYSCVVPGSGNILGGQAKVIRNFATNRDQAVLKDYGFKMALGYNPRSTTKWKGTRPTTRMGIYGLLQQRFEAVLRQEEKAMLKKDRALMELEKTSEKEKLSKKEVNQKKKWIEKEYKLEFSPDEWAILQLLRGEKTAKVHVHKEDDALFLIELANKYKMKVTADHTCDIFHAEIFNELARNHIPVVYGPVGSLDYKVELKHALYQNAKIIMQSKAFYGLMTDHPIILTPHLRESLKYFLIQGMKEEEAISLITHKNAKILGLDKELGTIKRGKLASLIVWDKDPLHLGAYPLAVIAEGRVIRKKG